MSAQREPYNVIPDSELARLLDHAEKQPLALVHEGVRYRVVREADAENPADPWANYDPEKMLAAIEEGAGALEGIDVEEFLREIYKAREQDTPGRPA